MTSHWDEQNSDSILNGAGFPTYLFVLNESCLAFYFLARQQFCFCTGQKCIIQLKIESKFMRCGFDLYALPQTCACTYHAGLSLWALYGLSSSFQQLKPALAPLRVVSSILHSRRICKFLRSLVREKSNSDDFRKALLVLVDGEPSLTRPTLLLF